VLVFSGGLFPDFPTAPYNLKKQIPRKGNYELKEQVPRERNYLKK
jgi:hypothetical protein